MPVALQILLGFAVSNDMKNTPFVVYDEAKTTLSNNLILKLGNNKYFSLTDYLHSYQDIDRAFERGKCKLAIVFPSNFENDLIKTKTADIQVIIDASDPNEATNINNYLQLVLMQFKNEQAKIGQSASINGEVKMLYNPQIKSTYSFVPGLMGMLMMIICALMTSISIVREKERGTMEVLLISPLNPFIIVLAKCVPYFIVSMSDVAFVMFIAHFVMGVPITGNIFTLLIISVVFTLAALSLGMLISSIANDQQTAIFLSLLGLMVPAMLLSGTLFPIESMPRLLQIISNFIPAKWYISAIRAVMIKGVGLLAIWKEALVLGGMTIFLIFGSVKQFKNRL